MQNKLKLPIIISGVVLLIILLSLTISSDIFLSKQPDSDIIPDAPSTQEPIQEPIADDQNDLELDDCIKAGCSGELCLPKDEAENIFTTCEFKPEYACYQEAVCKRLDTGECGFVMDESLETCLEQAQESSL